MMSGTVDDATWASGTWEGSRREQLRRSLALSVRDRLQALENLAQAAGALNAAGARNESARTGSSPAPEGEQR
jgi:hypothetical protein